MVIYSLSVYLSLFKRTCTSARSSQTFSSSAVRYFLVDNQLNPCSQLLLNQRWQLRGKLTRRRKQHQKNSWFISQLNAQDLALRRLRDAVPGQVAISHRNWLTVCWGDMATLLGSLFFIKPIREGHAFFMIQFNAVDRPETGHTHSS